MESLCSRLQHSAIRDGDIPGHNITVLEESAKIGCSLDAAGTFQVLGYVMRGGRMFESKYLCTFGLFSSILLLTRARRLRRRSWIGTADDEDFL